jgi:hypothetical protein
MVCFGLSSAYTSPCTPYVGTRTSFGNVPSECSDVHPRCTPQTGVHLRNLLRFAGDQFAAGATEMLRSEGSNWMSDLRVIYSTTTSREVPGTVPTTPGTVPARESRPESGSTRRPRTRRSWNAANQARRRYGRRLAIRMFVMRLGKYRATEIAAAFNTTPGAVLMRLCRLRRGQYSGECRG